MQPRYRRNRPPAVDDQRVVSAPELEVEVLPNRPGAPANGVSVRLCWRNGRVSIGDGFDPEAEIIAYPVNDGQIRVFRPTRETDPAGRRVFFEESGPD